MLSQVKEKKGETDKGDDMVFLIYDQNALAGKKSLLDEYDILCDNQATINIFRNKKMLKNIRKTSDPISIGGVGGVLEVDQTYRVLAKSIII